ncbi:Lipase 3, partial [Pseudolycoriella hygida]
MWSITIIHILIYFNLILAQDDITKIIENSGYPAELHTVVTDDDYILSVHRIPLREPTRKIALLMHGLHCTAFEFLVTGRSSSL